MRKSWMPKSALWALDFGENTVTALAAREKSDGQWQLLGEGRSRAQGRVRGEIVKLSDVCESVIEALRQAEKASGLRCRRLYFNFDDVQMHTAHPLGSKVLSGEGQIRRDDVREAAKSASRMAGDFERACVYLRDVHYLIDGKDAVANPVGVFGHRLDVTLHMVLARAAVLEQWKNVMRRAQLERFWPVLSLESCLHAVLERTDARRILWDAGDDFVSGGVTERGLLREYRVFWGGGMKASELAEQIEDTSRQWAHKHGTSGPVFVTGDQAEKVKLSAEYVTSFPHSLPPLAEASDAAAAGLVLAASQRERRLSAVKPGGQWARHAREKANAFLQEYF